MALQMILGGSGSGKSTLLYQWIIEQAEQHPEKNYIVMVPDQFTLQTQRELIRLHPRRGILNIDVLSFQRLAYRVFDETGADEGSVLTETGKNLVLRKVAGQVKEKLRFLGGHLDKEGYVSSVRSVLSEFAQYEISDRQLTQILERPDIPALLRLKLEDILVIRDAYADFCRNRYITGEEILGVFAGVAGKSEYLKGCTLAFDGFTGFTPVQMSALRALFPLCEQIRMAFTLDPSVPVAGNIQDHELFALSRKSIQALYNLACETDTQINEPVILGKEKGRFTRGGALEHLEKYMLRPGRAPLFQGPAEGISLHLSRNPAAEAGFAARTVLRLVRENGYRFRDIAIIAGDLPSYDYYLKQVFDRYGIPLFIDQKTKITLNPCLEFIRAAQEMAQNNLSYESVIRYLRTGFSSLSAQETDLLENYLLARGIRGKSAWKKEWTALTEQVSTPEQLARVNGLRTRFLEETGTFLEAYHASSDRVCVYVDAIMALMRSAGVEESLDRKAEALREKAVRSSALARAMEYEQVYEKAEAVLSEAKSLLGEEKVTRQEFGKILDAGFENARIGVIPTSINQVYAGDLTRTRLSQIRALIFVGLADSWVPGQADRTGIISDHEREYLKASGMKLAPGERETGYQERFYEYLCLTKPSEKLILSWPGSDSAGKAMRPSYLVHVVRKMFPALPVVDEQQACDDPRQIACPGPGREVLAQMLRADVEKAYEGSQKRPGSPHPGPEEEPGRASASTLELLKLYRAFEQRQERKRQENDTGTLKEDPAREKDAAAQPEPEKENAGFLTAAALAAAPQVWIDASTARLLYGDVQSGSVSQMETFAACPFRYFAHYGLNLQEREAFEINAADIGSIFHRALEKYAAALGAGGRYSWSDIPEHEQAALADRCVKESCQEYHFGLFDQSARNRYAQARIGTVTRRMAWALTKQVQAGRYKPVYFEQKFLTGTAQRETWPDYVRLSGKIDRIDLAQEEDTVYLKIIDYKSGRTGFDLQKIYDGQQLQLAVYLQQALQTERLRRGKEHVAPGGIFYEHLSNPVITADLRQMVSSSGGQREEAVQEQLLQQLRPDGLTNPDPVSLRLMATDPEKISLYTGIRLKRDGSVMAGSPVADERQFQALTGHVTRKIISYALRIRGGDARVMPYTDGRSSACDFCGLSSVCRLDRHLPGSVCLAGENLTRDQIWERLMTEEENEQKLDG